MKHLCMSSQFLCKFTAIIKRFLNNLNVYMTENYRQVGVSWGKLG